MEHSSQPPFDVGASLKRPPLFRGVRYEYPQWKKRMMIFIKAQDIELWKIIALGPHVIKNQNGTIKKEERYTSEDWKKEQINAQAMHILLCSLNWHDLRKVSSCESAQEIWKMLESTYGQTDDSFRYSSD